MKRHNKLQGQSGKENSKWSFRIKCINNLLPTLVKRKIHNPKLYQNARCQKCVGSEETQEHLSICPLDEEAWLKKEEEILIKLWNELKSDNVSTISKEHFIDVFMPRNRDKYKSRHVEMSRGLLEDEVVNSLKEEGLSSSKAQKIATKFLDKWLNFFQKEIWRE